MKKIEFIGLHNCDIHFQISGAYDLKNPYFYKVKHFLKRDQMIILVVDLGEEQRPIL